MALTHRRPWLYLGALVLSAWHWACATDGIDEYPSGGEGIVHADCRTFGLSLAASPRSGVSPLEVAFAASVSDTQGDIALSWDFGDGASLAGAAYALDSQFEADVGLSTSRGIVTDGAGGFWILREPYSTGEDGDVLYRVDATGRRLEEHAWPRTKAYKSLAYDGVHFYASRKDAGLFCPCSIDKLRASGTVLHTIDDSDSEYSPASLAWGDDVLWADVGDEKLVSFDADGSRHSSLRYSDEFFVTALAWDGQRLLGLNLGDVSLVFIDPESGDVTGSASLPTGMSGAELAYASGALWVLDDTTVSRLTSSESEDTHPTHTYRREGTHTAIVTATPGSGDSCSVSIDIDVLCSAGNRICSGDDVMACTAAGAYEKQETCGADEKCSRGSCVAKEVCHSCRCVCNYCTADTSCTGTGCGGCYSLCSDACADCGGMISYADKC